MHYYRNACHWLGLIWWCLAVSLTAQTAKLDYTPYLQPQGQIATPVSPGRLILALVGTSVAIILAVWLLKKLMTGRLPHGRILCLKESLYLGNKTFLHAVEIRGKLVVIGTGPQPLTIIAQLDTGSPAGQAKSPDSLFAQFLDQSLGSSGAANAPLPESPLPGDSLSDGSLTVGPGTTESKPQP